MMGDLDLEPPRYSSPQPLGYGFSPYFGRIFIGSGDRVGVLSPSPGVRCVTLTHLHFCK
jgi:hypothetical protein